MRKVGDSELEAIVVEGDLAGDSNQARPSRRSRVRLAFAGTAVIAGLAGVALGVTLSSGAPSPSRPFNTPGTASPPATNPPPRNDSPDSAWSPTLMVPGRRSDAGGLPVVAGLPNGLFVWDADSGYLVDPDGRNRREIPPPPLPELRGAVVVAVTPTAVILFGSPIRPGHGTTPLGASFDLESQQWASLPAAPPEIDSTPLASAWSGTELLVWGRDRYLRSASADGAAYNPATRQWRPLPPAPVSMNQGNGVWHDGRFVIVGSELKYGNQATEDQAVAIAYEPTSNSWATLPSPGLSPQATWTVAVPDGVLAWDYSPKARLLLDGASRWIAGGDLPFSSRECYPTGASLGPMVVAGYCDQAALYDTKRRTWASTPPPGELVGPLVALDAGTVLGWTHNSARLLQSTTPLPLPKTDR